MKTNDNDKLLEEQNSFTLELLKETTRLLEQLEKEHKENLRLRRDMAALHKEHIEILDAALSGGHQKVIQLINQKMEQASNETACNRE